MKLTGFILPVISISVIVISNFLTTDARSVSRTRYSEQSHPTEDSSDYFESGELHRGRGLLRTRSRRTTSFDSFPASTSSEFSLDPNNHSPSSHSPTPQNPQPHSPRLPPHNSNIPPHFPPEPSRLSPFPPRHAQPVQVASASDRLFHLKEKRKETGWKIGWKEFPVPTYRFNFRPNPPPFLLPQGRFLPPSPTVRDRYEGSYDSHGSFRGKMRWLGLQDMEEGRHEPLVRVGRVQRPRPPPIPSNRGQDYQQGNVRQRQVPVSQPIWNSNSEALVGSREVLDVRVQGTGVKQIEVEVSEPFWTPKLEKSRTQKSNTNVVEEVIEGQGLGQSESEIWIPLSDARKYRQGKTKFSKASVPSNHQETFTFTSSRSKDVARTNKKSTVKQKKVRFSTEDLQWEETKAKEVKLPVKSESVNNDHFPAASFNSQYSATKLEDDLFENEIFHKKKASKVIFAKKRPEEGWDDWEVFNKAYK